MDEDEEDGGGADELQDDITLDPQDDDTAEEEQDTKGTDDTATATKTDATATATGGDDNLTLSAEEIAFLKSSRSRSLNLGVLDQAITKHSEQSAELEIQQKAQAKVEDYGQQLFAQINAGEITQEEAKTLYNQQLRLALLEEQNSALTERLSGIDRKTSVEKIRAEFPYANPDLLSIASERGVPANDLRRMADEDHKRVTLLVEQERAKYATDKKADKDKTSAVPTGTGAGGRTGKAAVDSGNDESYWSNRFGG